MTNSQTIMLGMAATLLFFSSIAAAQKSSSKSHLEHLKGIEARVPFYLEGIQCDPVEAEEWSSIYDEINVWRQAFNESESKSRLPAELREGYQEFLDDWTPSEEVLKRCAAEKGREATVIRVDKALIKNAYEVWGRINHFSTEITCDDEALAFYISVHDAAKRVWSAAKENENGYWMSWTDQDAAMSADWRYVKNEYGFYGDKQKASRKSFDAKRKSCK